MPSPESHSEVRLEKGERVARIKNYGQKDWMRACERLGLSVRAGSGKGSHCAVYTDADASAEDRNSCVVTIPTNVYENFQRDLVKKIVLFGLRSGRYAEDDVWKALKVKS